MQYNASLDIDPNGKHFDRAVLSIEPEGIKTPAGFFDFSDISAIIPNNYRVYINLFDGTRITVSMLGHSYDGFWEELVKCFNDRSLDSLFIEEECLMNCYGEYTLSTSESGRGRLCLYPDSICILPENSHAVRIPLCYTADITLNGYMISVTMRTGEVYSIGKMGYDTKPFAERSIKSAAATKKKRAEMIAGHTASAPFSISGLFRTMDEEKYWTAAIGKTTCALELFTGDSAATYLYRFDNREFFLYKLEEAMEAVGSHREIIYQPEEMINANPLYKMAVHRSPAVRSLRSCSAGRIIHNEKHRENLMSFLD